MANRWVYRRPHQGYFSRRIVGSGVWAGIVTVIGKRIIDPLGREEYEIRRSGDRYSRIF